MNKLCYILAIYGLVILIEGNTIKLKFGEGNFKVKYRHRSRYTLEIV